MSNVFFTEDHEWLEISGEQVTVGITDYAQQQLGDVVFVDLPEVGADFSSGDEAAVIESVKAAGEVYAPVGGKVTAVNQALADDPELLNRDPQGEGWIFKISLNDAFDPASLMDKNRYQQYLDDLS